MASGMDGAIGLREVAVVVLGFGLGGCTTPITLVGEDTDGSSTGGTDASTTSVTSSTTIPRARPTTGS